MRSCTTEHRCTVRSRPVASNVIDLDPTLRLELSSSRPKHEGTRKGESEAVDMNDSKKCHEILSHGIPSTALSPDAGK